MSYEMTMFLEEKRTKQLQKEQNNNLEYKKNTKNNLEK